MTPQRFADLALAYGADIARWPSAEQAPARALAAADPSAAAALDQALILDRALDASPSMAASRDLYDSVVAEAPRLVARSRLTRWLGAIGVGAALATACASGVAVGAVFAPTAVLQLLQPSDDDPLQEASSLIEPADSGSQSG